MKKAKRNRLEAAGWRVGAVDEFLGLSPEETAYIEMKLALARRLRALRLARELTQHELAKMLGSSQSRVARMESADTSVTVDAILRALFALGDTREKLAKALCA
ncbi:MAG: helix-turn-helix transcriptional regulator [bacterium]